MAYGTTDPMIILEQELYWHGGKQRRGRIV
jgi:hypothetical protein